MSKQIVKLLGRVIKQIKSSNKKDRRKLEDYLESYALIEMKPMFNSDFEYVLEEVSNDHIEIVQCENEAMLLKDILESQVYRIAVNGSPSIKFYGLKFNEYETLVKYIKNNVVI